MQIRSLLRVTHVAPAGAASIYGPEPSTMPGLATRYPAVSGGRGHPGVDMVCAVLSSRTSGAILPGQPPQLVTRSSLHCPGTAN
jgi:hypothetical protein